MTLTSQRFPNLLEAQSVLGESMALNFAPLDRGASRSALFGHLTEHVA